MYVKEWKTKQERELGGQWDLVGMEWNNDRGYVRETWLCTQSGEQCTKGMQLVKDVPPENTSGISIEQIQADILKSMQPLIASVVASDEKNKVPSTNERKSDTTSIGKPMQARSL